MDTALAQLLKLPLVVVFIGIGLIFITFALIGHIPLPAPKNDIQLSRKRQLAMGFVGLLVILGAISDFFLFLGPTAPFANNPSPISRIAATPTSAPNVSSNSSPSPSEISRDPTALAKSQTLSKHQSLSCDLCVNQPMQASVDSVMVQDESDRTLWYIRVKNTGSTSLLYGMTFELTLPNGGTIRKTVFENYPFSPGEEKVFTIKLDRFVPSQNVNYLMFTHMIGEYSGIYTTRGSDLSFDPMTFVFNS